MATNVSIFAERLRKAFAAVGIGVRSSATQRDADVPTITSGSGAPSASEPNGSLYMRTGGGADTTLYQRVSGAWVAVEGAGGAGVFTTLDVNGEADAVILDADADTTISSPTDDQIDFEVGGSDVAVLTASALTLAAGVLLDVQGGADAIVLDDDGDTTLSAPTDDQIDIEVGGSDVAVITASAVTLAANVLLDLQGGTDALVLDADGDTTLSSPTDDQIDVEVGGSDVATITASALTLADGMTLELRQRANSAGAVAMRWGGAVSTEGVELYVAENTVSPAAVETAVCTVPAGAVILSVQANCESALTGGGTTVTWAIGTTGDPDKYGYPGSDTLAQNSKVNTIPDWAVLGSSEAIVLSGAATGGTADGDTALTVGSVRVVVTYLALNALADAA